ncbi:LysR substrate-binding domain-containing protein [Rhizobium paknamense]|uniref:DNA-binding transcriptional LysR family regulator n=1 Tax=Rhizobium paknamense TaxID=1206817 RepID=A0ABU0IM74_9HYPH|nr:LysR substrate-binding domain-containing protein [Rhizobium paknamense]MDQ0458480.1 DNA-binding transcriptional LysR family regulator [Rhizobium paknamense]
MKQEGGQNWTPITPPEGSIFHAETHYLERLGFPQSSEDLGRHRLLDKLHGNDLLGWSDVLASPASDKVCDCVAFRSDDFEALNSAAIAGMGIALLPAWVSGPSIKAGELIRIRLDDEPWNDKPPGIHLLRALQEPSAKVRVFTERLKASIGSPPIWS